MTTYPLLLCACAFSVGVVARSITQAPVWLAVAACGLSAIATIVFLLRRRFRFATGSTLLAMTLLGFAYSSIDKLPLPSNHIRSLLANEKIEAGEPVEITGVIETAPELAPERIFFTVRLQKLRVKETEMLARGTIILQARVANETSEKRFHELDLRYGSRLRVLTRLDRPQNFRNPGVSAFTEYLDRQGYDATGLIKSPLLIERLEDEPVFLPLAWLYQWRGQMLQAINSNFSHETAGILDAAMLGNRYFLSQSTSERFREGGTFHVLVISGLHISFLGAVVFLVTGRLTRNRLAQFFASTGVLWTYTVAVGAQASVVRAALMFTIVMLAPLLARDANSRNALGASALILLVFRPDDLFDPSFQLTFGSVAAIVLLAWPLLQKLALVGRWQPMRESPYPPSCSGWLRVFCEAVFWSERKWRAEQEHSNYRYKLRKTSAAKFLERFYLQAPLRYAFSTLVISCAVQLVLLPLLVLYFHRLSIASLVLNVGVSFLMALTAILALMSLLLLKVSGFLAFPLFKLTNVVAWLMIHSVDPFARAGVASIRLPEYSGWAAAMYVCYFLPLVFLLHWLWKWQPSGASLVNRTRRPAYIVAIFVQCVAISLIVFHPFTAAPDNRLHVDFLDVGQGDSALVTAPDGTTILIDGGGQPGPFQQRKTEEDDDRFERDTRSIGEAVVSEFLWHRGLDHVDYLIATHADADHIDGLNDIARNFRVRAAFVARSPQNDPEFSRFAQTLSARRIPLYTIGAGDELHLGNASATVLWPPPNSSPLLPSQNNDSIVLKLSFGNQVFLFTGDVEAHAEESLIEANANLQTNVLKVAHHGSRTSSTPAFVNASRPVYAVISVGQTSIFGHPNPEVVKRWQQAGAIVLRTGKSGTISFSTDGRQLDMQTFVK